MNTARRIEEARGSPADPAGGAAPLAARNHHL